MLTTDVPRGKVALKSKVEFKILGAPRSEGLAMHGNAKKAKAKPERKISSIASG